MRPMDKGPFANIRGVFFDLDGTLKVSTPSGVDAVLGYMSDYGIAIDQEARRAGHRFAHEYWANRDRVEDDMERLGPDSFWANYIRAKMQAMAILQPGQAPDETAIAEINHRFATEFNPVSHIADNTVELLAALRAKNFILGLVSNRPLPLKDPAERLGIYEYFHFTLAAGEIGSWKPDSGIFHRALEMAGYLEPQEAVYVGDNYYADAIGAHDAGLNAILIDPLRAFPEAADVAFIISDLADLFPYLNETSARAR
jgi:HAD superfamily hydrolase (TIGR01549 family)